MKSIMYLLKVAIAGIVAFAILNLLCLIYHYKPLSTNVIAGATATKYEGGSRFSIMEEGWGRGRVNDDGYNNEKDIQDTDRIDALLMGSSQMEAFEVNQNQATAAVLNSLFEGKVYTYNVGISGHNFFYCVHDLENALSAYEPEQFAIIELPTVEIGSVSLEDIMELSTKPAESEGIIGFLKSFPYIRLLAAQYAYLRENGGDSISADGIDGAGNQDAGREDYIDCANTREILSYISDVCGRYNVVPVVFLYQSVLIDDSGNGYTPNSQEQAEAFGKLCEAYGIEFVDTSDDFLSLYEIEHKLPTGFANTLPGTGHLNKYGHEIIAENLYENLSRLKETGNGI